LSYATFSSFESHIKFLGEKYAEKISASQIPSIVPNSPIKIQLYVVSISEFIVNNFPTEKNVWTSLSEQIKTEYIKIVSNPINFVLNNVPKP
jgi:hypothetical protein